MKVKFEFELKQDTCYFCPMRHIDTVEELHFCGIKGKDGRKWIGDDLVVGRQKKRPDWCPLKAVEE